LNKGEVGKRNHHKLVLEVTKPHFFVRVPSIHGIRSLGVFSQLNNRGNLHKSPKLTTFTDLTLICFGLSSS